MHYIQHFFFAALCLTKDSFIKCPKDALIWETRRLKILEEILTYSPDILCLQEVDHFGYLKAALESVGYKGHFFPKPDSPALYTTNSNGPDGCAVFYDSSKLNLIKYDSVILETLEGYATNQVAVNAVLKIQNTEDIFCVANTHLKAKEGWERLRQHQGQYLLKYLRKFAEGKPLIICGDFNAESSEGVYDVMSCSDLNIDSAYKMLSDKDEEPAYTTWKIRGTVNSTSEVCRTIDYIWYSKDKVKVDGLLELPTAEQIGVNRLPSYSYPSDHLSLVADFLMIKN